MSTAALYIRVSTDKQEELSPDAQKRLLLEYAQRNNYLVPDKYIFIENGLSGRSTAKRPQFNKMIALAKTKPKVFDVILVWKFSRFARNREDSIVYKSMLRKQCQIDVISITENLGDSKISILIEAMLEAMDEYYSINLSEEVFRGMSENALRGKYQSKSPFGYKNSKDEARLQVVSAEAQIVKRIFTLFVEENKSAYEIAKLLNQANLKTSLGNPFETRSINYILQNPIYIGDIRWNRTHNASNLIKDKNEWIITKGIHEAIIDQNLFLSAQHKLSRHKAIYSRPIATKKHWLSGLLKCSNCGRTLCFSSTKNKKTGKIYSNFQCYGYQKGLCNSSHHISEKIITNSILNYIYQQFNVVDTEYISSEHSDKLSELSLLNHRLQAISKKEVRIIEAYQNNIDSLEDYKINKEKVLNEKSEINLLIDLALSQKKNNQLKSVHNLYEIMSDGNLSNSIKNEALSSIIEKIVYSKNVCTLEFYYRKFL